MMLHTLNIYSNIVILLGAIWALFTDKVPTKMIGSTLLGMISICTINNMASPIYDSKYVWFVTLIALFVIWSFYKIEILELKYD